MQSKLGIERTSRWAAALLLLASSACSSSDDGPGGEDGGGFPDRAEPSSDGGGDAEDPDAGDSADSGTGDGFAAGQFDPAWTRTESARMFWGLGEGSCQLFRSTAGPELADASVEFTVGFGDDDTWDWSFRLQGEDGDAWTDRFLAEEGALRLASRLIREPTEERSITYGLTASEPPVVLQLDRSNEPTETAFTSEDVEGSVFVRREAGGGSGMSLGLQDHEFVYTEDEFTVESDTFSGYTVVHQVDEAPQVTYRVVPALGIVGLRLDGVDWELCDFRVCSPSGCIGRDSCDELSCDG